MRYIASVVLSGFVALGSACSDDGTTPAVDGDTTSGGEITSTLPLTTTVSPDPTAVTTLDGSGDGTGGTTAGIDDGTGGSAETDSNTSATSATSASGTTSERVESSGSGSGTSSADAVVEWCILQFPPEILASPDEPTEVYARLYVEGVTDQSEFVDEDPLVVAEFGYGVDGSIPDDGWNWVAGLPNPAWDGTMAKGGFGNENNDEYLADLSFPAVGTYDYAARFSADGGATWVYCDLDDLETGGYTPDQAGNAVIEE